MSYQFYTCDVFTNTRFGGNPLAVLVDSSGLTGEQMGLIAREFNYSECTFLLPAEQGHTARVRIFARLKEFPFAGHPNVGTAFVMATLGMLGKFEEETSIVFEELAGPVPITVRRQADGSFWCELKAPQSLSLGKTVSAERMATILSISPDEIVTDVHLPQFASVGLPYFITELKSKAVLEKINVNLDALRALSAESERDSLYVYTHSQDEFDIRCRMFAPLSGTFEDPATGSANCALAGLLAHYHPSADGTFNWHIAQGVEMGRPSVLDARAEKAGGDVTGVWIAGESVMVSQGTIEV
ncbi:MAG: PhzF family phenazine biosynthesis protein [Chloroflexota bacterium]